MIPHSARRTILPEINPYTEKYLGLYVAYQVVEHEHIATVIPQGGLPRIENYLRDQGYERNGLAAAKLHPDDPEKVDVGSFRKIPDEHPDVSGYDRGSADIVNKWDPEQCQYHVHVFQGDQPGVFELYSHYEVRPDFLRPKPSPRRLSVHYSPIYHVDYLLGISDLDPDDVLNSGQDF